MKPQIAKLLSTNSANWSPVALRLVLGLVMAGHGAQKLFGWFGGYGLDATAGFFAEKLGLTPASSGPRSRAAENFSAACC